MCNTFVYKVFINLTHKSYFMAEASVSPSAPIGKTFLESIKESAQKLGAAPVPKEEVPFQSTHTMQEVNKDVNKDADGESNVEEVVVKTEPVTAKIENIIAKKAEETITKEAKIEDFEFDEDTSGFLKDLYKEENKESVDVKSKRTTADIEEEYRPYKEKATEYEAISSDPLTKAFIEWRKNGGEDPSDFIKKTGVVDIKSLTPEQLLELDMKENKFTEEEIAEEMDRFKDLSAYEKRKQTKSIQDEFAKKRDEKLKTFTTNNEQVQKVVAEATKRGTQELDSVIQKMTGKSYKGLLIAPEMVDRIRQEVIQNPVNKFDEKGQFIGFDIQESIRRAVILNFDEQRSKSLIEIGKTMGADKALTARIRPNKKEVTAAVIPTQHKTLEDIGKDATDKMWKKRGVK